MITILCRMFELAFIFFLGMFEVAVIFFGGCYMIAIYSVHIQKKNMQL